MPLEGAGWPEGDPRFKAGLALLQARQFYSALQYFRKCLSEGAGPQGWFLVGAAQHALGQREEAAASFEVAARSGSHAAEARCARATVLSELGRDADAEHELRTVIAQHPAHARALANLAIVLERRGAKDEALERYGKAIAAEPGIYAARLNRGAMRLAREEAHLALADFDALLPGQERAEVHIFRARALFALHRDQDALDAAERALMLEPRNARAWLDRVLALSSLRRLDEAAIQLEHALAACGDALLSLPGGPRRKEQLDPSILYLDRTLQRQDVCAWQDRARVVPAIRAMLAAGAAEKLADPGILFRMLALPLKAAELKALGEAVARRVHASTRRRVPHRQGNAAATRERIRVGFLSPEFRAHPGAWLLRRLFRDRDAGKFEFHAYALNADDGSAIRAELASASDAFVDVSSWQTENIVQRMRTDQLDLLVDSSGFLQGTRPEILSARVAPVQAGFIGIACTLGPGLLDYRISDAFATPSQSQPDWFEKLVLVPAPHFVYDAAQPVGEPGIREAHGLPSGAFVFSCFSQPFKLSPEVYGVWMRILQRMPGSVLWLLDNGAVVRENLLLEAARTGVEAERIVFAPRVALAEHLGRMRHADLFLDTLYCAAHTSAVDALYAGLPVLTCPGETMASRLAGAFVRCAGIGDMAVDTLEAYERKAIDLARHPAALAEVRERLARARANAPLFATAERVRAVERALIAMVERSRTGLPPDTLIID